MGVLQSAPLARDLGAAAGAGPITDAIREVVRSELGRHFWRWYEEHARTVLLSRKILFFSVHIRVSDLRGLFVTLFGERPLEGMADSPVRR